MNFNSSAVRIKRPSHFLHGRYVVHYNINLVVVLVPLPCLGASTWNHLRAHSRTTHCPGLIFRLLIPHPCGLLHINLCIFRLAPHHGTYLIGACCQFRGWVFLRSVRSREFPRSVSSSNSIRYTLSHSLFGLNVFSPIAVPFPINPAPPRLMMPNFAQPLGGFGRGESASDETFFFAVLEEYGDCEVR